MGFSEKFGVESIDGKVLCSCANCAGRCFWFILIQILIRRNNIMMQDDCNGFSNKVLLLINEIDSYDSQNDFPSKDKTIKIIIGDDVYPSKFIQNTSTNNIPFYKNNGFNHVAFLTKNYTLDLLSILSILFDSTDKAAEVLKAINCGIIPDDKFAKYLLEKKNTILINSKGNVQNIKRLITNYPNNIILFVGSQSHKRCSKFATRYLSLYHCSPKNYAQHSYDCISSYFCHDSKGFANYGNVKIKDFKI